VAEAPPEDYGFGFFDDVGGWLLFWLLFWLRVVHGFS
jgi:hypothetical protein